MDEETPTEGLDQAAPIRLALQKNPKAEADLQWLADRSGLSVEAVRARPEGVRAGVRWREFDYDRTLKESPRLAEWYQDYRNASVAADDKKNLSALEAAFTPSFMRPDDLLRSGVKGVVGDFAGRQMSGAGTMLGIFNRSMHNLIDPVLPGPVAELMRQPVIPWWLHPQGILQRGGGALEQAGAIVDIPQERQTLATDTAAALAQITAQVIQHYVFGAPAAAFGMLAQGVDAMDEKTAKDTASPGLRDTAMVAGGAATVVSEKLGLNFVLRHVPQAVKQRAMRFLADIAATAGVEAATEAGEGIMHDLIRVVTTNKDASVGEGIIREATPAGVAAGIFRAALGIRRQTSAQQTEDLIRAIADPAKSSSLRERLPERYKALIDHLTKDGPVTEFMIPAERFVQYFQGAGVDPAQAATDMGASNFDEAVAAGVDVVIPAAEFLTNIAPSDHLQGLAQDIRLRPDAATARELAEDAANRETEQERVREQLDAITAEDTVDVAIERIVSEVEGQLLGRYDQQTARAFATTMRGLAVLAARNQPGANPVEAAQALWDRFGLKIKTGETPEILTAKPEFGATLDPLLDDLRAGRIPTERDIYGQSLLEWIRENKGLVDQDGELRAMDVAKWDKEARKPGQQKILRSGGMPFDTARELALEAGYDVGEDINSFLAAVESEVRGEPVYMLGAGEGPARNRADTLEALAKILEELGINIKTAKNAEIKVALRGEETTSYEQSLDDVLESETIEITAPPEVDEDEARFLSLFPEGSRYGSKTKLLGRIRRASEAISNELGGKAETPRQVKGILGAFSGYEVTADILPPDSFNQTGSLIVQIYGHEQIEVGLEFEPALTITVGSDGALTMNGPVPGGQTFSEFKARGWAVEAVGADGAPVLGYSALTSPDTQTGRLPTSQVLAMLADVHARVRAWTGRDRVGLHWSRATGALGGLMSSQESAAYFQDERGVFEIGTKTGKLRITLNANANWSTFLHEGGHLYLHVMGELATDEGGSQQVKDDYAAILKFLGVSSKAEIKTEHHEKFAKANEAYLFEGRAPSVELRGVFARFSLWLKALYKSVTKLGGPLSDEVRGVFDRIYATDAEIELAQKTTDLDPLFSTAEEAGMTEGEFSQYANDANAVAARAKEKLRLDALRTEKLKRERWWRDELAGTRDEVAAEYDATKQAQAHKVLLVGPKLSTQGLVDLFGQGIIKRLPRYGGQVHAEDGGDVTAVAAALGYNSAAELVDALVNLPSRARYIAAEAQARMQERFGDALTDISIADKAIGALHNESREAVLLAELKALHKQAKKAAVEIANVVFDAGWSKRAKLEAGNTVGRQEFRSISPGRYLAAERRANKASFQAMAKGDLLVALTQKRAELLNHYLFIEALRVKGETEQKIKTLRKFALPSMQKTLGKAGGDYRDQMNALLQRYELQTRPLREIPAREALAKWVATRLENDEAAAIPESMLDETRLINWRKASPAEIADLYDAATNIAHLASLANKIIRKGKAVDFAMAKKEMIESALTAIKSSTGEFERPSNTGRSIAVRGAAGWRAFDAAHIKIEQLVEWLDGGKVNGPWARYLFDLADHAQTTEYDMHEEVTKRIGEIDQKAGPEWHARLFDEVDIQLPGIAAPVLRYDLISIALNMGNEGNLQRLRDGNGFSERDLAAVLGKLSVKDMEFVQGVWDALETLWPRMAAMEQRVSGVEPPRVERAAFEAAGRTWAGGYFPIAYDPRKSTQGAKQDSEAQSVTQFLSIGYGRAHTDTGATKARVERVDDAPLRVDFGTVLAGHLAKVIKDVSHRESVMGMNKILQDAQIKEVLIDKMGESYLQEMNAWVKTLVMDRADTSHQAKGAMKWAMNLRTNTAIVTMGWKISTMLTQIAGYTLGTEHIKGRFFVKGMVEYFGAPMDSWAMITEKSGEMRHRAGVLDRDMRDALRKIGNSRTIVADVQRTAFMGVAFMDRQVSAPIWLGGYRQALTEGMTEEDAIRTGDRAVRLSQGSGGAKDLAAVQRNNELMRLMTMYYTPFSVLYARLRDVGHKTRTDGIGYLPAAVARFTAIVVLPAVMSELLAARGPDEDEDPVWWAARRALLYPLGAIPFLRESAGYLEAEIIKRTGEGKMRFPPEFRLSPIIQGLEKLLRAPGRVWDGIEGTRPLDDALWDSFEASGYLFGLPTGQTRITGEYLTDLLQDRDPAIRDALFKPAKP